jgi:transposase
MTRGGFTNFANSDSLLIFKEESMALSRDLRLRVVGKVAEGMSRRQAAAHFGVSTRSAIRFAKRFETEGHVEVRPRPPRQRRLDPYGEDIRAWIREIPDLTLAEISARLGEAYGVHAPLSTIDDWLRAKGLSYKKNRTRG